MASKAENNILILASKYNLEEGQYADYYKLHSTWCLTKHGALKIRQAENITYKRTHTDVTPVSYVVWCDFTSANGTLEEIGSCRWDSGRKNPEATHAPEMAMKRCLVRGTIAMMGNDGIGVYGDEEFTDDFKQGTTAPPQRATPSPVSTTTHTPQHAPQSTATPAVATNVNGTTDWGGDPRYETAKQSQGWFPTAVDMPQEWNNHMGRFTEITSQSRGAWEQIIFDHCGKFQFQDGGWWKPSRKYTDFASYVFAVDPQSGKSKAGGALNLMKKVKPLLDELESMGQITLEVPSKDGALESFPIQSKSNRQENTMPPQGEVLETVNGLKDTFVSVPDEKTAFDSDVPF
tara:strand:+ start:1517 stop:2557 length:1041 start_codon:yes stop_codon:yes gene_type:complete